MLFSMPDSLCFTAVYHHRESKNIELAYMSFAEQIARIKSEIWKEYEIEDVIHCLTSSHNFRYDLYPEYKSSRKKQTEEAKVLKDMAKELKRLLYERLGDTIVKVSSIGEADDTAIEYSHKGYLVVAQDGDVILQSVSPVFDYHKKRYTIVHKGLDERDIFFNIIHSCIEGGHNDGVSPKGKGKVFADKFIEELKDGKQDFVSWTELYLTPSDALLSYQLTDCNQVKNNKLELLTIEDISKKFEEYVCPF